MAPSHGESSDFICQGFKISLFLITASLQYNIGERHFVCGVHKETSQVEAEISETNMSKPSQIKSVFLNTVYFIFNHLQALVSGKGHPFEVNQ